MDTGNVIGRIRSQVDSAALVSTTRDVQRSGCRLSLQGISGSNAVLVDVDRVSSHRFGGKRCDFVLFLENSTGHLFVILIELKNTRVEPSDVCAQLQAGAHYASTIIPKGVHCRCVPVVIHGKSIHTNQRRSLSKKRVTFQKNSRVIKTEKCNLDGNLMRAISR